MLNNRIATPIKFRDGAYVSFIAALLLYLVPIEAKSQPIEKPSSAKTKLEAFNGTAGSIVIKGYSEVGTVGGRGRANITAMTLKNPSGGRPTSGLVFDVEEASGRSSYQKSNRSFIDYDEITGLIEGINYISKSTKSVTPLENFEATYTTRGDLAITVFNNPTGQLSAAIKSGSIGASQVFIDMDQLPRLISFLEKGKQTLDSAQ